MSTKSELSQSTNGVELRDCLPASEAAATGVAGLDAVLGGGLRRSRIYLLQGEPGTGKTTIALQFLLDGAARGERVLYITLSETTDELVATAASHGWSLDGVELIDLDAVSAMRDAGGGQSIFHSGEVDLGETMQALLDKIERSAPGRVVLDSTSEIRLLASNSLRYRRQILDLKRYFTGRRATVLLTDDRTSEDGDLDLQSLAHGVIALEHLSPDYGVERRRLRIIKIRGQKFIGGYHDFSIRRGGVEVFPRLPAPGAEDCDAKRMAPASSGVPAFDRLLGGGIEHGTSALILGPAGTGKSSLAVQHAIAAAERGERAIIFSFDESIPALIKRSEGLGMNIRAQLDSGRLEVEKINTAHLSPGEFFGLVRQAVEKRGARVVIIDSLNGYMQSMPDERFLIARLHELMTDLSAADALTILVAAQHGLIGESLKDALDLSYLADTVVLLRYFESFGRIRRAVSVIKKRTGRHEPTIRELRMQADGLWVGEPLSHFRGILTGVPEHVPNAPEGALIEADA